MQVGGLVLHWTRRAAHVLYVASGICQRFGQKYCCPGEVVSFTASWLVVFHFSDVTVLRA